MEIFGHYQRVRLLLLGSVVACFLIFWWTGGVMGIPPHQHRSISLLVSPPGPSSILVVAVVVLLCTLVGTVIAGSVRFEAGLFAACCGLSALSMRGGTMGDLLRSQSGALDAQPGVFWYLIAELLLLFIILGLAWAIVLMLKQKNLLADDAQRDGIDEVQLPLHDQLTAGVAQAALMSLCLCLLMQSDAKKQVIICVGLSAFVATLVAYHVFQVQPSCWFWGAPLIVGIVGYLLAYFTKSPWQIGELNQPLARALPLDYASAGPAGAMLGYWLARKSQSSGEMADEEDEETSDEAGNG